MEKNIEREIRNYLNTLTHEDIINSIHLEGIDFDNDDINKIMQNIIDLYFDVEKTYNYLQNLKNEEKHNFGYVENFEKEDLISKNLGLKYQTLQKVLSNTFVLNELKKMIEEKDNKKKSTIK